LLWCTCRPGCMSNRRKLKGVSTGQEFEFGVVEEPKRAPVLSFSLLVSLLDLFSLSSSFSFSFSSSSSTNTVSIFNTSRQHLPLQSFCSSLLHVPIYSIVRFFPLIFYFWSRPYYPLLIMNAQLFTALFSIRIPVVIINTYQLFSRGDKK
jgi:hypothetical protein